MPPADIVFNAPEKLSPVNVNLVGGRNTRRDEERCREIVARLMVTAFLF